MKMRTGRNSNLLMLMTALIFFSVAVPAISHAQSGINAQCLAVWVYELPCGTPEIKNGVPTGRVGGQGCPCQEPSPVGPVPGLCVAPLKCKAMSAPGEGGKGNALDQGMSKLGEILGKLMEALKPKDGGGGGGGGSPPPGGEGCMTLQPTGDKATADASPNCYYYQEITDPFGTDSLPDGPASVLSAYPTNGTPPLLVTFSYTNGYSGCNTPAMTMEFGDGESESLQVYPGNLCVGIPENKEHTYTATGTFAVRLKNAATGVVRGGVTITVASENYGGTNTGTGTGTETGAETVNTDTTSNITGTSFISPLNTIGTSGSVQNTGTGSGTGAALNFNTPQSIVQSIVQKNIQPGAYGDVKILDNGTTIIAGVRNSNSETAGFFGLSGSNTQGQSTVARLCTSRPWTTNFLSFIIPASFFDTLCKWRGYTPGTQPAQPTTTVAPKNTTTTKTPTKNTTTTQPATSSTTAVQPRVDIWASPATVPLGARTSIFWNTQGVTSCLQTSPDGSFSQNSLRGGASTVPLTAATTFTISCIGEDGKPYTDNVIVRIAL